MHAIAVDDERFALDDLAAILDTFSEITQVTAFCAPEEALAWLDAHRADVAFLDISMRQMDGLTLAKRLKERCPGCAIVFVTGYSEYALQAFEMHASGYLLKPVQSERLRQELDYILNPPPKACRYPIRLQCFGSFEVFVRNEPMKFQYSKTKELLAYLVDRRGAAANTAELCAVLWEDRPDTLSLRNHLRNLFSDLARVLRAENAGDIIIKRRNSFSIAVDKVDCDYFDFLRRNTDAVNTYTGEYMAQYSWAEMTLGRLWNET